MPPGAHDSDETTDFSDDFGGGLLADPLVTVLVIAWCREDPGRVGELAIIPENGSRVVLGRGAADDEPRVRFFRPLPGRLEPAAPLGSRGLSRRQVEIRGAPLELSVSRVGRCPMRINGTECETGSLSPGDTLAFRQELVLLCLRRPACPAPLRYFPATERPRFGAADALGILGESPATWRLRDELAFAAMSGQHVLLIGESGTGKELAARAVHRLSQRSQQALVARNAATLPSGILDAEVFGNLKNYPNPGMADRAGLVGDADGGFLFLDEIGELPVELQSHLLRVLDSGGEYQRLGESRLRRSDFRLLAATNRDPADLRKEFVARLKLKIELPPLTERREDIPLLVHDLVGKAAVSRPELAGRFLQTTPEGLIRARLDSRLVEALLSRDYGSNIRELDALVWRAIAGSDGDVILHDERLFTNGPSGARADDSAPTGSVVRESPQRNREPSEEEIRAALAAADGNVARAAKLLGLSSRYALYRMLMKLGIQPR